MSESITLALYHLLDGSRLGFFHNGPCPPPGPGTGGIEEVCQSWAEPLIKDTPGSYVLVARLPSGGIWAWTATVAPPEPSPLVVTWALPVC